MDEATLRQHIIMAEGKPPDSYVETRRITTSSGSDYAIREYYRGLDYRELTESRNGSYGYGRLEGREWDQNPNGLTTIHEPPSGLERPDVRKVFITRVSQPFDAWKYEVMNASETGTVEYIDSKTYRMLRKDEITRNGTAETDYDDFRTFGGYTIAAHEQTNNQINRVQSQSRLVSLEAHPVTDAEVAIPPSRPFVIFPAGQTQVDLPAEFLDAKRMQVTYFGLSQASQDLGTVAVLVRVDIGGRGVDMVLDSGSSGIVLDQNVVRDLGLREYAQRSQVTAGRYNAANAVIPSMRVGSLEMHNVVVSSLPVSYDAETERKVVGLLGYDFIRSVGLTIDYAHKRVIAMPAGNITPPIMTPESDILPIRVGAHVPMVTARINGAVAERMMVDTGWGSDMGLFDYFSRRYPEAVAPRVATPIGGRLFSGVGGKVEAKGFRLADVDVGRYRFKQFDVEQVTSYRSYEYAADGVIGVGILRRFAVTFDYAGGKMYLVHTEGQ